MPDNRTVHNAIVEAIAMHQYACNLAGAPVTGAGLASMIEGAIVGVARDAPADFEAWTTLIRTVAAGAPPA